MDDACAGGHHAEAVERLLAPAQELVALAVAFELAGDVEQEGGVGAELVDLHGVVDHEVDGLLRVDARRVAAQRGHRVAHRGEVDDGGHTGEVLEQHARGAEGDLLGRRRLRLPRPDGLDLLACDGRAVLAAQEVLEEDAEGEGQPRQVAAERVGGSVEPVDGVGGAAGLEARARAEAVHRLDGCGHIGAPFRATPW